MFGAHFDKTKKALYLLRTEHLAELPVLFAPGIIEAVK